MGASDQQLEISQSQEHAAAAEQGRGDDNNPLVENGPAGRWANLNPKLKKVILIGLVVGLIKLVAFIVLIVLLAGHRCSFRSSPPSHMTPSSVYTKPDVTNLAKFAGYIHVYGLGFLALDIKRMSVNKFSEYITLEDECVNLGIGYTKTNNYTSDATVSFNYIEWEFNNGDADKSKRQPYEECAIGYPDFHHSFDLDYHYSCRQRKTHMCQKSEGDKGLTDIAEIVFESFELELDGDEDKIYRGQFSKPAWPSSCSTNAALSLSRAISGPVRSG